jgi:hypothetical protein
LQISLLPSLTGLTTALDLIPNDKATLSGATPTAGGSLVFKLFAPTDVTCAGNPAFTQTVSVNGPGDYSTTYTTFHATIEGTWRWMVNYTGDNNNVASSSSCGEEQFSLTNDPDTTP